MKKAGAVTYSEFRYSTEKFSRDFFMHRKMTDFDQTIIDCKLHFEDFHGQKSPVSNGFVCYLCNLCIQVRFWLSKMSGKANFIQKMSRKKNRQIEKAIAGSDLVFLLKAFGDLLN